MRRLPSNDARIAAWPNSRASVTSYKAPNATDFDHPRGNWCHFDHNRGACRKHAMETIRGTAQIMTDSREIHFENRMSGQSRASSSASLCVGSGAYSGRRSPSYGQAFDRQIQIQFLIIVAHSHAEPYGPDGVFPKTVGASSVDSVRSPKSGDIDG